MTAPHYAVGEFASGEEMLAAVRELRRLGFGDLDAYGPYPVEGAREALGLGTSWITRAGTLSGAIFGAAAGYVVQWWMNAIDWPIDVGNRPPHAWPAFILLSYEGLILCAAFAAFFALLFAARLPNLHHPVLGAEGFESATGSGFWVSVGSADREERIRAMKQLGLMGARKVQPVDEGETG